jgi:hypothetical protein
MAFIKLLILPFLVFSRTALLEFTAKQNIHNIRDTFPEQSSTFYIKGEKELAFSSNFKSYSIIQTETDSQFLINGYNKKFFLITISHDHHNMLQINRNSDLYLYELDKKKNSFIGKGVNASFQADGKYVTYYELDKKQIVITRRDNITKQIFIKINSKNKFFVPDIVITKDERLFFTDHNDDNQIGIIKFDLDTKKRIALYKAEDVSTMIELCEKDQKLFILESSFATKSFANLYHIETQKDDISERSFIYSSSLGPAHSLTCTQEEDRVYFIKKVKGQNANVDELLSVSIKEKKAFVHSDLKFVTATNVINGEVLIPYRRKIFHIKGKDNKYIINKELKEEGE